MMVEYYISANGCCVDTRWKVFIFWLNGDCPYNRTSLALDDYHLTNTHTITIGKNDKGEPDLYVQHDFEYDAPKDAILVEAGTFKEVCAMWEYITHAYAGPAYPRGLSSDKVLPEWVRQELAESTETPAVFIPRLMEKWMWG